MGSLPHGLGDIGVTLIGLDQFAGPLLCTGIPAVGACQQTLCHVEALHGDAVVCKGGIAREVGQVKAGQTPLAAQDVGLQALVCAGPDASDAGECVHDAFGTALSDSGLKALQVDFADGLLAGEGCNAAALGFRIVQGKVLDVDIHALGLDALHLGGCNLAGEERILGVILKVAAGVSSAVDVHSRAVQAGSAQIQHIIADADAHFLHQVHIEGGGHDVFVAVSSMTGGHTGQGLGKALRAVIIGSGRLGNALYHSSVVISLAHQLGHFLIGDLIQQLVPIRVVVIFADHHAQRHAVVGTHSGHLGGRTVNALIALVRVDIRQQGIVGLNGDLLRPSAGPVGTGEHIHLVITVVGHIGRIQLVGDLLAGSGRDGVGLGIGHTVGVGVGESGIAVGGHAVGSGVALGSQNIVHSIVGIACGGQVVITGLQNIGLCHILIVAGQLAAGHVDGNSLAFAGDWK